MPYIALPKNWSRSRPRMIGALQALPLNCSRSFIAVIPKDHEGTFICCDMKAATKPAKRIRWPLHFEGTLR